MDGTEMSATAEKPFKAKIVWLNVVLLSLIHAGGFYGWWLAGSLQLKWQTYLLLLLHNVYIILGATLGVHRYYSHKSFKAKLPLQLLMIIAQTMSGQTSVHNWVRDHRLHHKYSDTDADPHNSRRGLFFSHIGWLMVRKHPDVMSKGRRIELPDIKADPLVMFQYKYYLWVYLVVGFAYPTFFPHWAWNESIWNSFFGLYLNTWVLTLHSICTINSLAHAFGNKPFTKDIEPTENIITTICTLGEGWHNFHHSFPFDYRAAELGSWFNYSGYVIHFFSKIGWAYDLRVATPEMIAHRIAKRGDGTHPLAKKLIDSQLEMDDEPERRQVVRPWGRA